jgi:hypothetical protein
MRIYASFQGICSGLLLAAAITVTARAETDAESMKFFPWSEGDEWTYSVTNKEKKETFEMKVTIEAPWKDEAGKGADKKAAEGMIMTQRDKRGQMREFLTADEKGIFIKRLGVKKSFTPESFVRFTPAVPRVIFPLTPGTKTHWEGRLKILTVNKPVVFDGTVVGWEEIEVPAGKFRCIKVHFDEKRGDEAIVEDAWYAEGVGQVKYDGGQYLKVLKSYKVGAKRQ